MKYDVFISYSRKDLPEVKAFKEMLEERVPGIRIWFDLTGVESGEEFIKKIITAIDSSERVLFFLSDNALASHWTEKEVMYAHNTHKKLVPILLRGAELKGWFLFQFGNVSYTDITVPEQVDKLVRDLGGPSQKPELQPRAVEECQLKVTSNVPCTLKIDGEVAAHLEADRLCKLPLRTSKYLLRADADDPLLAPYNSTLTLTADELLQLHFDLTPRIKADEEETRRKAEEEIMLRALTFTKIGNGGVSVKECDQSFKGPMEIPSSIFLDGKNYLVTSIGEHEHHGLFVLIAGDRAFDGCSGLTAVTIPNTITSIGNKAFRGCSGLTAVTIPDSVTSIGELAFASCIGLTAVTIPDSVTSIGKYAFSGCIGLSAVSISNAVTSISGNAFSDCKGLTAVTIPHSVTSIEDDAFYGCSSLKEVFVENPNCKTSVVAFVNCHPDLKIIRK